MRGRNWILAGIVALALGAAPEAGAIELRPGDIIVADLELGGQGGLIHVDPVTGKQRVLSSNDQPANDGTSEFFDDPYDATVARSGYVLAAEEYDAGDVSDGGVVGVSPGNGKQQVVSSNALGVNAGTSELFVDPWGVIVLPGYGIVVGDYNAFGDGALIGVDETTGKERVFSSNDQPVNTQDLFTSPARLTAMAGGDVATVTQSADPGVVGVDPDTGEQRVVSANSQPVNDGTTELFNSPQAIDVGPDGTLYVADSGAFPQGGVIGVNPVTGKQRKVSANDLPVNPDDLFSNIGGVATDLRGNLVVVNRDPDSVVGVSTATGTQSLVASNDTAPNAGISELLAEPYGITVVPPRCAARFATAFGGPGGQTRRGDRFSDVLAMLGGRDTVKARGGNDRACGGAGRDRLVGGPGEDVLDGGPGRDVCVGGPGEDRARRCEVERSV
jgi:Ca2+-binding RTX toxin-like protein